MMDTNGKEKADRNTNEAILNSDCKHEVSVPTYFSKKVVAVRLFTILLLLAFSPVILLLMLLVRITSTGPALFRQTRLGKDGKPFVILKLRTMYCDAEDLSGPVLCQPGDSRITPLGVWLRFLHLDELPQLINVVRGDMCLVGPRPERPEIIARNNLEEVVPGFTQRTFVRPGVTGLAQINLPADITTECVIPKVRLDLEYIDTANAWLDFRILLCTALRMLGVRHGRAVRALGLARNTDFAPPRSTLAPVSYFGGNLLHTNKRSPKKKASAELVASIANEASSFPPGDLSSEQEYPWSNDASSSDSTPDVPRRPR